MAIENDFIEFEFSKPNYDRLLNNSHTFLDKMSKRRSVREFSTEDIPEEVILNIVRTATSAPSGGNAQPFFFCIVKDKDVKHQIREAAEKEEKINYEKRYTEDFKKKVSKFKVNFEKPFLDEAPYIIVVFKEKYKLVGDKIQKNNYFTESAGIAIGFLITAIHNAGLVTLPYTPSPMSFLSKILNRPENESPVMVFPVGYPKDGVKVPNLKKKKFEEMYRFY
ncbi:MAG: nitroreductase family protein [Bacteroidetes bacterium]|nr:MAG: nitroreductase family protein [Bacteroidota bacterium]